MFRTLKNGGISIFILVWLGQLVSLLGSSISNFAINIWVYQQSGSVTQLSLLILITTLPLVIISPFAGVLVDRWNRRWIMIVSDSGTALCTLTIAILLFTGNFQVWHIYIANALSSCFSAFQWPAYSAATTLLVPKKHLGRAGGMTQLSKGLGQLLAPVLGGLLLGIIQLSGIIILDLTTFVFALSTLLLVRFPRHKISKSQQNKKISFFKEVAYGFDYLKVRYGLLLLLFIYVVSSFLVGIVQVLAYPLVLSFASPAEVGKIGSIGGVGMLVGGLIMSAWGNKKQNYINTLFLFMLLQGFSTILLGLDPSIPLLTLAAFMFALTLPFINSLTSVIFQKKIALDVQGRVFSIIGATTYSSLPLACLVAGPLADKIFEPLMTANGLLAESVGQFIGVGSGRGIGLMFIVFGILFMFVIILAYMYPTLRLVDDKLPDAI